MKNSPANPHIETLASRALELAATQSWASLTLADLCVDSDVTLATCAQNGINKLHIARALDEGLDVKMVAANSKVDHSASVRDRLFDVVMGRYDAMEDHRAAWVSILEGDALDPLASIARRARRARSGAWALEASGVSAVTLYGGTRALGLARILRACDKVWVGDGPDLAKTMAKLDQSLRSGEEWLERAANLRSFLGALKPRAKSDSVAE